MRNRMQLFLLAAIVITALFSACPPARTDSHGEEAGSPLTLMVYMCGSNLESGYGAASADIEEMKAAVRDQKHVTVLLMTGGSSQWSLGYDPGECLIQELGPRGARVVRRDGARNMGDPDTLTFFVDWCMDRYPAQRTDLVLWNHGGGPMIGLCADQTYGLDMLSLQELATALENSCLHEKGPLELIGFDACLMSSVEVAAACAPYARYMVASEEIEPVGGWDYGYLAGMAEDRNGGDTGRRIADGYLAANADQQASLTLSCLDLSRMDALTHEMDALFSALAKELTAERYAEASRLRERSYGIARMTGTDYDLIDLAALLNQFNGMTDGRAQPALDAMMEFITCCRSTDDRLCGLAVYYPYYNKDRYTAAWNTMYAALSASSGYAAYVDRFARYLTGPSFGSWHGLETRVESSDENGDLLTIQLTEEQVRNFSSASLVITQQPASDSTFAFLSEINDVALDDQGVLSAHYDRQGLIAVDRDGHPLTDSLLFYYRDGRYMIPCILQPKNIFSSEWANAEIVCAPDPEDPGRLRIQTVYASEDADLVTMLDIRDWSVIEFIYRQRLLSRDADGQVLPFDAWEAIGAIYGYDIRVSELDGFAFVRGDVSDAVRYAHFQVTDTQNNTYGSEPARLPDRGVIDVPFRPVTLVDDEDLVIVLSSVQYAPDLALGSGVILTYRVTNRRDEPLQSLQAARYLVNRRTALGLWEKYKPWNANIFECRETILFSELAFAGVDHLEHLSMTWQAQWETQRSYEAEASMSLHFEEYMPAVDIPVLAESRAEGIHMALQKVNLDTEKGRLSCRIHVTNESGRTVELDKMICSLSVNGCVFGFASMQDVADLTSLSASLPPSCDLTFRLQRSIGEQSLQNPEIDCDSLFSVYGIPEIRQIGLELDGSRFTFDLPEPVAVPDAARPDLPVLMRTNDVTLYLESVHVMEREPAVQLVLIAENHSDQALDELALRTADPASDSGAAVNGVPVKPYQLSVLAYGKRPLPAHAAVRSYVILRPDLPEENSQAAPLPLETLRLPFLIQYGDSVDQTTAAVLAPEAPVTETGRVSVPWTILPAQLP